MSGLIVVVLGLAAWLAERGSKAMRRGSTLSGWPAAPSKTRIAVPEIARVAGVASGLISTVNAPCRLAASMKPAAG